MKKKINFIANHGSYPFQVMVSIGESVDDLEKQLIKHNIPEDEVAPQIEHLRKNYTNQGRTIMFSGNQTVLWIRNWPKAPLDYAVLSHEIFHSVDFMMYKVGLKLNRGSDEAYAYQIQYLTEQIYSRIIKK